MLRILFSLVILVHGLIHVMGFAKGFGYGNISQLTANISRPMGLLWMAAAGIFIAAAVLFFSRKEAWVFIAIAAVLLSQFLIFTVWKDARFGTVANLLVLSVALTQILQIKE